MKINFEELILFSSKAIIVGIIFFLVIYSIFGNIFNSLSKTELLISKVDNIFSRLENINSQDNNNIRFILDGFIINSETLFLLAKNHYDSGNFDKSLYYLNLIDGIRSIEDKNLNKIKNLRKLVETKVD